MLIALACNDAVDPVDATLDEIPPAEADLAMVASDEADAVAAEHRADLNVLYERVAEALRNTDNPEALECLRRARELHRRAQQAREEGHLELARELAHRAFLARLCAVVAVLPDAPARVNHALAEALERIEARLREHLGDREIPERVARVLNHVGEIQVRAAELVEPEPVLSLALSLRGFQILRRLVHHLGHRHGDEDDATADGERGAVEVP